MEKQPTTFNGHTGHWKGSRLPHKESSSFKLSGPWTRALPKTTVLGAYALRKLSCTCHP